LNDLSNKKQTNAPAPAAPFPVLPASLRRRKIFLFFKVLQKGTALATTMSNAFCAIKPATYGLELRMA
jgi:hypothetical protein